LTYVDFCRVLSYPVSSAARRVLRHKNLSRTEIYIKKINNDLKAAMNILGQAGLQDGLSTEHQNTGE